MSPGCSRAMCGYKHTFSTSVAGWFSSRSQIHTQTMSVSHSQSVTSKCVAVSQLFIFPKQHFWSWKCSPSTAPTYQINTATGFLYHSILHLVNPGQLRCLGPNIAALTARRIYNFVAVSKVSGNWETFLLCCITKETLRENLYQL